MNVTFNKIRAYITATIVAVMMSHNAMAEGSITLIPNETLKGQRLIEYVKALFTAPTLVGFPSVPGIDSATTAPHGLGFVSISGSERTGVGAGTKRLNATVSMGVGIGSAEENISVQPTLTLTTIDDLGAGGYAGLKFSRRIRSGNDPIYVGLAFNRLGDWGDVDGDPLDKTRTISLTGFSSFITDDEGRSISDAEKYPVMWTLGYGEGVKELGTEEGFQAGIGVGVYKNTAFGMSTNGDVLNAGFSHNLPDLDDINLSFGFSDIFDNDDARSFYIAASYTFQAFGD